MIRIGVVGAIGSGKSYVSKSFGFPLFNADAEVAKLYKKDKKIFIKLKKVLPKYFDSFPVKKKKVVILDIPLLLENKINKKKDVLIFVQSKQSIINKKLKKRKGYNKKLFYRFKNIQLSLNHKKKKSHFIINNDFTKKTVEKYVKHILGEILK